MILKNPLGRLHLSIGKRVFGGFSVVLTLAGVLAIVSAQNVRGMQGETARSGASAGEVVGSGAGWWPLTGASASIGAR